MEGIISHSIGLDDVKHIGEGKNDNKKHDDKGAGVNYSRLQYRDEVGIAFENPHPVEHFEPHKPATNGTISSDNEYAVKPIHSVIFSGQYDVIKSIKKNDDQNTYGEINVVPRISEIKLWVGDQTFKFLFHCHTQHEYTKY